MHIHGYTRDKKCPISSAVFPETFRPFGSVGRHVYWFNITKNNPEGGFCDLRIRVLRPVFLEWFLAQTEKFSNGLE